VSKVNIVASNHGYYLFCTYSNQQIETAGRALPLCPACLLPFFVQNQNRQDFGTVLIGIRWWVSNFPEKRARDDLSVELEREK